jgi:hypothetical protein
MPLDFCPARVRGMTLCVPTPQSPPAPEALAVLELSPCGAAAEEEELLQGLAGPCGVPRGSLAVAARAGATLVVRVSAGGAAGDARAVRDAVAAAAADGGSALRAGGLVVGAGRRPGRWEAAEIAVVATRDMHCEADFVTGFVLPALRARLRARQVALAWRDFREDWAGAEEPEDPATKDPAPEDPAALLKTLAAAGVRLRPRPAESAP